MDTLHVIAMYNSFLIQSNPLYIKSCFMKVPSISVSLNLVILISQFHWDFSYFLAALFSLFFKFKNVLSLDSLGVRVGTV